MKEERIHIFYREEMSLAEEFFAAYYCKTPFKPGRFLDFLRQYKLQRHFALHKSWAPFEESDFLIAHEEEYVRSFFQGEHPLCSTSGLPWSPELGEVTRYTNASLYEAIRYAVDNPNIITLCPAGGFHRALPACGADYSVFSGQVIAALKIFRETGKRGAWIDLGGEFGASLEFSREAFPELNEAAPEDCHLNPPGVHGAYLRVLGENLEVLGENIRQDKVDYIVFCHGADSHIWDEYGFQCNTQEWLNAARAVYAWFQALEEETGKSIPLALSLFDGYRSDDFNTILSLHTADLVCCLNEICGVKQEFDPAVSQEAIPIMLQLRRS